ncbi:restriction endonuclease [Streptomyces longwoodensis]|uniref:restriction endonuclease n=1 Tax=Streptomyces longwoodensis TaxID=68231 RepID=UPI00384ED5EF
MIQTNSSDPEVLPPSEADHGDIDPAADAWKLCDADEDLRAPVSPGSSGRVPHGEDLDLHLGWDRFEKLVLALARRMLGLRGMSFRRYGVQGQKQHGIDLAGRDADGSYTVVQCKEYASFTPQNLRDAVEEFTGGRRPFGATRFVVATSSSTEATQFNDELHALRGEHPDLELDLWGAVQINEHLRYNADIVAQFWTRETATDFCTGSPPPGVPAPPPDRQDLAERILVGPLNTDDVKPILRAADSKLADAPAESAGLYGTLATRLHDAGYRSHSTVLRRRQLEALEAAEMFDDGADLAAELAATALHQGDSHQARILSHVLDELARKASAANTSRTAATTRHAALITAAVQDAAHPFTLGQLQAALANGTAEPAPYQALLVLMLAEYTLATQPHALEDLDGLITAGLVQAQERLPLHQDRDTVIRLRLLRAEYDRAERQDLLREARQHRLPGRHVALISAREARRCALQGRAEEALEGWRDAVHHGILAGLAEEAADWLYAIRVINVRYGPWTIEIDDEHRLAQSLRTTGTDRLLDRVRDPKTHTLSAVVSNRPSEAVQAARRWLTDSVVTGSWADEDEAVTLLGDLYRDNNAPDAAAVCYQRAGQDEKLKELAQNAGSLLLPAAAAGEQPWWVQESRAVLVAEQADLADDTAAQALLDEMLDLAARGRNGELVESPTRRLTTQAAKTACALVPRSTREQAVALLDLLAPDVPRGPAQYALTDQAHVMACLAIADTHPALAMAALTRLFDLADVNCDKALRALTGAQARRFLSASPARTTQSPGNAPHSALSEADRDVLRGRADKLAEHGHYLSAVIQATMNPDHPAVRVHAEAARERILQRPEPHPHRADLGSSMVPDSFMVSHLPADERKACLDKLLAVAGDRREIANSRIDALQGACNLVLDQEPVIRRAAFHASQPFVSGGMDGSRLDELAGTPHPLSTFKINLGTASLRGPGLFLAAASATTPEEQGWVRDQALDMLRSEEPADVAQAALALSRLPSQITQDVDPRPLVNQPHAHVRQLCAVLSVRRLSRHADTAQLLAADPDVSVRRTLAEAAADAHPGACEETAGLLDRLGNDPHFGVRRAARPPAGQAKTAAPGSQH